MANTAGKEKNEVYEEFLEWKKVHDQREKDIKDEARLRENLMYAYVDKYKEEMDDLLKKQIQAEKDGNQQLVNDLEQKYLVSEDLMKKGKIRYQKDIDKILEEYRKNAYAKADLEEKMQMKKRQANRAKEVKENLDIQIESIEDQMQYADDLEQQKLQNDLSILRKKSEEAQKEYEKQAEREKKIEEAKDKFKSVVKQQGTGTYLQNREESAKEQAEKSRKKEQEAYERLIEANEYGTEQEKEDAEKAYEQAKKKAKEDDSNWKKSHNIAAASKLALDFLKKAVDSAVNDMQKYYSSVTTRLQGSGKDFESVNSLVRKNLATNPYVKITSVLDSINQLTQKGVVYDLETRGYLLSMKDELVATFDATNGTLLRLIRLQQADTTAARMGMQSELTKFLNAFYQDSSYLAENVSQSISDALLEATSQMTNQQGLEFEWIVQKWLGSLVSLGLSSTAAQNIAQGLNWLSTGNVQQLSGNDPLQTLLAMSSSRAGQSYADILTRGLNAQTTNELLKSMVEYLAEIAQNENQVVKSAYANIFNMSVADLRAISNMTEADIGNIYRNVGTMQYANAMTEIENQLSSVSSRVHLSTMVDNIISNLTYTVGSRVAENPFLYGTYKLNRVVEQFGENGLRLPFLSTFGTGFDLNASINQLVDFGLLGAGLLGSIGDIASSLGNVRTPTLGVWNPQEVLSRGQGFRGLAGGLRTGTSQSQYIGNAGVSDMKESTLASQAEQAREDSEITGTEQGDYEFDDLFKEDSPVYVKIVQDDDKPMKVEGVGFTPKAVADMSRILPKTLRGITYSSNQFGEINEDTQDNALDTLISNLSGADGVKVHIENDQYTPVYVAFSEWPM